MIVVWVNGFRFHFSHARAFRNLKMFERNSRQACAMSGAFRMADTTQIRCAPAANTSSRLCRLMPPLANHGMVTFAAAPRTYSNVTGFAVGLVPVAKTGQWRCNQAPPPRRVPLVPEHGCSGQFQVEGWETRFGSPSPGGEGWGEGGIPFLIYFSNGDRKFDYNPHQKNPPAPNDNIPPPLPLRCSDDHL
jgi:hypothetical protein